MQWILDNWLLLLLGGGMVAMHLFGHGHGGHGHGGHGHGGHGRGRDDGATTEPDKDAGVSADKAEMGRDG